jgi:hypothetical protein
VDAAGASFPLPGEGEGRVCAPVWSGGEPVAMLVHAAHVAEVWDFVRAVGGAAALALENERLDAELRAKVKELRASHVRIVESAGAAGPRIERDLHDGAQQRSSRSRWSSGRRVRSSTGTRRGARAAGHRRARPRRGDPRAARARPGLPPGDPDRPRARCGRRGAGAPDAAAGQDRRLARAPAAGAVEAAAYFVVAGPSPTSPATPTATVRGHPSRSTARPWSSHSPMTVSAVPTRIRAPGWGAWPTAPPRWTAGSTSTPLRARHDGPSNPPVPPDAAVATAPHQPGSPATTISFS